MLSKDVKLYPYRIFTVGGHVHQAWVPFEHAYDFWDHIYDLKHNEHNKTVEACYFEAGGGLIMLFLDAADITSMDTPFDRSDPKTIQLHGEQAQAIRTRHMRRKQEAAAEKRTAGQSVKKRRG